MGRGIVLLKGDALPAGAKPVVGGQELLLQHRSVGRTCGASDAVQRPSALPVDPAPHVHRAAATLLPGGGVAWSIPLSVSLLPVKHKVIHLLKLNSK